MKNPIKKKIKEKYDFFIKKSWIFTIFCMNKYDLFWSQFKKKWGPQGNKPSEDFSRN